MAYLTNSFDNEVVGLLRNGGAGLLPTDTVYGLSCRALNQNAVERLHELKGRDPDKPFIILISDTKMLDLLSISAGQAEIAASYWPGALSVIFDTPRAPAWLTRDSGSLAVRLPDHPQLVKLIDKTGPLISTSANLQGREPAHSAAEAKAIFGDGLDFYVDFGRLDNSPSTLVAVKDGQLNVIRQGAVKIS